MRYFALSVVLFTSAVAELGAQPAPIDRRWACEADRVQTGFAVNDHIGHTMAAGDWDGDGLADILTGGLHGQVDPLAPEVGKAWLFRGNPWNSSSTPHIRFNNIPAVTGAAGTPIAFVGDLDGDGSPDIAIGAPGTPDSALGVNVGAVWIFLSPTLNPPPFWNPEGVLAPVSLADADIVLPVPSGVFFADEEPHFGFSVAAAGDVNDDGYPDVIVGAPGPIREHLPGEQVPVVPGRAFLYLGTDPGTWSSGSEFLPPIELNGGLAARDERNRFGWSVAGLGDVNGDGFHDVAVGAIEAAHSTRFMFNHLSSGFVDVWFGSSTGVVFKDRILPFEPPGATARLFGHAILGGEDFNADGLPDILVGSPDFTGSAGLEGAVYAYSFSAFDALPPVTPNELQDAFDLHQPVTLSTSLPAGAPFLDSMGRFGWSLAAVGQYNPPEGPDNRREFAVGALQNSNAFPGDDPAPQCTMQGGSLTGRVFVISVGGDPLLPEEVVVQGLFKGELGQGGEGRMRLGTSVATG